VLADLQQRRTKEQWLCSFLMVQDLLAKIADSLYCNPVYASNSSGSPTEAECRLLMPQQMVLTWI
jgi:hypothetical protein